MWMSACFKNLIFLNLFSLYFLFFKYAKIKIIFLNKKYYFNKKYFLKNIIKLLRPIYLLENSFFLESEVNSWKVNYFSMFGSVMKIKLKNIF
jgi:hypothetical protein